MSDAGGMWRAVAMTDPGGMYVCMYVHGVGRCADQAAEPEPGSERRRDYRDINSRPWRANTP